jgi:hypothetical protein
MPFTSRVARPALPRHGICKDVLACACRLLPKTWARPIVGPFSCDRHKISLTGGTLLLRFLMKLIHIPE